MKFILLTLLLIGSVYTASEACPGSVTDNVCDCSGAANSATKWDAVSNMCVDSCSGLSSVNTSDGTSPTGSHNICVCSGGEYIDFSSGTAACTSSTTCSGSGQDKDNGLVCVCTTGSWNTWLDTPACEVSCPNDSSANNNDICVCPSGEVFNPFMNSCESDCTGTTNAKANTDGDLCIPTDVGSYVGWNKWLDTPAMVTACPNETSPGDYDFCKCPTGEVFNPFMNSCESDCTGTTGAKANSDGDLCIPPSDGKIWNAYLQTPAFVDACPGATQANGYKICACPDAGDIFNPFNGLCDSDCSATATAKANGDGTMCVPPSSGKFWNPFASPAAFQDDCTGLAENADFKTCECASGKVYDSLADTPGCVAEASCSYGDGADLGKCACTESGESYISQLDKCGSCPTGMTSNSFDVCGCYVSGKPVYDAFAKACVADAAACDTDNANDDKICVCATQGQGYNNWLDTPACGACPAGTEVNGLGVCHCKADNTVYDPTTSSCVAQASCPASAPYSSADMQCKCSTGNWDPFLDTPACAASCSGSSAANYLGVCACTGDKVWDAISSSADCADACPTNATANASGTCECKSGYTLSNNACTSSGGSGNEQNTGSSIMHFALALLAIVALLF